MSCNIFRGKKSNCYQEGKVHSNNRLYAEKYWLINNRIKSKQSWWSLSLSIVASRFFSFFFSIRMQLLYSAVYSKAYPPWKAEQTALTNVVIWCIQRPVICWRPITFLGKFSIQGEEWKIVSLISLFIRVEINSVWIFQLNKNSNGDDSTLSSEKKQIKTKTFKNLRKTRNTGLRKEKKRC
jgi:hypothetical protein